MADIPPPVPPSGGDYIHRPSAVDSSMNSGYPVQKLMIARGLTCLFSLISFSVTASVNNYSSYDALKFTVAMGVIVWLYTGFIVFNFIMANFFSFEVMPNGMIEKKFARVGDWLLLFLNYTATICVSVDSSQCLDGFNMSCGAQAAAATFMWFTSFMLLVTIYIRTPEYFHSLLSPPDNSQYDDIDANASIPESSTNSATGENRRIDL